MRAGGARQPGVQGRAEEAVRHRRHVAGDGRYLERRATTAAEEDRTRRLARPLCFLRTDPTDNGYARPIEGIRPVVDLNTMQVIRVEEYGHWPLPPQAGNYAADRVPDQRTRHQAAGDHAAGRAELRGRRLPGDVAELELRDRLQRPRRTDAAPPPLQRRRHATARFSTARRSRRWSCPTATRRRRSAARTPSTSASTAWACAPTAWSSAAIASATSTTSTPTCATSRGEPLTIKNAICMHEEDFGILWKHTDRRLPDAPEVRRSRRLVVSSRLHGRELRVRLLLVSLPGRQHPVRDQAHRHPVARRPPAGRDAQVRHADRAAALRPESPALLQRPARLRPRRRGQHGAAGRRGARRARRRTTRFENAFRAQADAARRPRSRPART